MRSMTRSMKWPLKRSRFLVGAVFAIALGLLPASAFATSTTSTTPVTAGVTNAGGDNITLGIPTDFGNTPLSASANAAVSTDTIGGAGTSASDALLTLDDATGTDAGWTSTVQATALTEVAPSGGMASGTTALVLPAGSLEMGAPTSILPTSSQPSGATVPTLNLTALTAIDGSSPVTLATAASGTGAGSWGLVWSTSATVLQLNLSNNSKIVDLTNYPSAATPYSSTVTVTMTEN